MDWFGRDRSVTKTGLFVVSLYPSWRLLCWQPQVGAGLASIPVMRFLEKKFKIPPSLAKVLGFCAYVGLLLLSWILREFVVLLAAGAVAGDLYLLGKYLAEPQVGQGRHIDVSASDLQTELRIATERMRARPQPVFAEQS